MCALKTENMCAHSRFHDKNSNFITLTANNHNNNDREEQSVSPSLRSSTTASTSSECLLTPQNEAIHPFDMAITSASKDNSESVTNTSDHNFNTNALQDSLLLLSPTSTSTNTSPKRHRGSSFSSSSTTIARKESSIYPSVNTSLLLATTAIKSNIYDILNHRPLPQNSKSINNNATTAASNISRYLPQNQAVITTQDNWRISIANNNADRLLSGTDATSTSVSTKANNRFIGRHILDFIAPSHKTLLLEKIVKRREEEDENRYTTMNNHLHGTILICGDIIPIVKQDGSKSSVSLWLKEKKSESSSSTIFIWIFEELVQTTFKIKLDDHDCIIPCTASSKEEDTEDSEDEEDDDDDADAFQFLLGYSASSSATDFFSQPIQKVLPQFNATTSHTQTTTTSGNNGSQQDKFFGCRTKHNAYFPVMVTTTTTSSASHSKTLRITSMPTLADLVTVDRATHVILSCNPTFAKHLFGYDDATISLVQNENVTMDKIMPEFSTLVRYLERDELLLDDGYVLNNTMCRDILHANDSRMKGNSTSPYLTVQHRDGTRFEVDIQIKLVDKSKYALWITFDRDVVLKRYGHATSYICKRQQAQFEKEQVEKSTKTNIIRAKSVNVPSMSKLNSNKNTQLQRKRYIRKREETSVKNDEITKLSKNVTSYSRPSFSPSSSSAQSSTPSSSYSPSATPSPPSLNRHRYTSSFSSMSVFQSSNTNSSTTASSTISSSSSSSSTKLNTTSAVSAACANNDTIWPRVGEYSAQTLKVSINDYEIIDELGQGAYGYVKLAYLKRDPTKKRVVIKYVIKSRILVDCWTRDRTLGLIPAEIHVLHTLRKIPHINCSDMLDYFEDDEHYYVVMDLYGAGMDLFDYIEMNEHLKEKEIKSIFKQVALAVAHLHAHQIVHRDIKDENVILDMKGGVRLIDFGSAAYVKQGRPYETFVGTLDYAAPEILLGQSYAGPPQDIWACGTLLYTLIYRENPFYNIEEILDRELRIPFKLSEESVDLIKKMLNRDVNQRVNIQQVLDHPWLTTD
ncbi:hypothetical protein BDF20DRAFT_861904 [Mycotypha africana]|uniref:uncharacterized protein n=1 Tax=Mycotypha africana TaxID=64632 RepID=UPI002300CA46|nr:uncharacterized protein BDF20DRAFT_861904 [Mycotypha africana]KAI8981586.1 hypothetical protein BDF20DRAFT_861904 [Mycotypha africana]